MDDLFTAIKMFNGSMQELATTRAVNDAREQVQQINTQVTKEGEKRQAFQALANDLALRLAGAGAPATTIQSAFQAVAPEQFANPEQAQWAGMLNQADSLEQAAEQGIAAGQQRAFQKGSMELGFDIAKMREQARLEREMLMQRQEGKPQGKPLNAAAAQSLADADEGTIRAAEILNQIKAKVTSFGPASSRVPMRDIFDKDFAAFQSEVNQFFNAYRKEITGAGASEKELEDLRRSLTTANDPPAIMEAKLKRIIELASKKKKNKLQTFKKLGFDIGEFEADIAEAGAPATQEQSTPSQPKIPSLNGYWK